MRVLILSFLVASLVTVARPLQAASWVDTIVDWFSELFTDAPPPPTGELSAAMADSLRATPLGLALNAVPESDTLAGLRNWPYESVDVANDLSRYNDLLRRTVLLTDPAGKLPISAGAVRVIYQPDDRPRFFLDVLARFADVQEVPFNKALPQVLPVSVRLPTIIISRATGAANKQLKWYQTLDASGISDVTLVHFGAVGQLGGVPSEWAVLNCPAQSKESETFLAQALMGAELIDARLTETTPFYRAGTGYRLFGDRGGLRVPEQLGIDREALQRADHHIHRGIRYGAMPGAQLVVMKDGHVVYEKSYGRQSYRRDFVANNDLYDLASVTKAAATTLAVMKLYDEGQMDLKMRVRDYLPHFKHNVVGRYRIDQLLAHQTGLQSNLPVQQFMTRELTADSLSFAYRLPLGPGKFLDSRLPEWVEQSLTGPLEYSKRPTFLYSDINFYLLQLIVERVSGEPIDQFVTEHFYRPMGLGHLTYLPTNTFPTERLVPTVHEPWMRGGLLRGYVHDEGAALLGGVAGHAGLFGNARDLAKLFQLFNGEGTLDGVEYFRPETVAKFINRNGYNYRALGFDRLAGRYGAASGLGAGALTVGHLGYTGTSVWADPDNDLVYVLLTNRVSPDPKNNKFQGMNIRSKVTREVYRSLHSYAVES